MGKFYSPQDCRRKADQHWDMAGEARQDNDKADEKRHTDLARAWSQRAYEGGFEQSEGKN